MTAPADGHPARWKWIGDQAVRLFTALPLGYAVASAWAVAIARGLPLPLDEGVAVGMLVAFVVCAVTAIWAYAAASGWRALCLVVAAGLVALAIIWLMGPLGGPA